MPAIKGALLDLLNTHGDESGICQDGIRVSYSKVCDWAFRLAESLSHHGNGRVAVSSPRADFVTASILACQLADRELLLFRGKPRGGSNLLACGASVLIDEELNILPVDAGDATASGFQVLISTSGTTGTPKTVRHSLEALLGRIRPRPSRCGARWLLTFSPASFAGLQVLLTAILSGDELIAVSEPTVTALTRAAVEWQPTHISATPTFWRGFLVAARPALPRMPIAQITLGGEIADQNILDHLRAVFPSSGISHIYATSEAGAVFAVKDGRAGFPVEWLETGVDGTRLRIVEGVLEVHTPRAMVGYLEMGGKIPHGSNTTGWIRTGDSVTIRGDRVYFLGRVDSVISVGGSKVAPEEVENLLLEVPGVLDGRVFGIRNAITGFLVAAEIVTDAPDHEGLRQSILSHLNNKLERHKTPRIIRFVTSIPTSQTGKKRRLDEQG